MTEVDFKKISEILLAAQRSTCHRKLVKTLRNVYEKLPFDTFFKEFSRCLKHFLLDKSVDKQNPYVDNGLEFCVLFSTSFQSAEDDSTSLFLVSIFRDVLKFSNVGQARYRVCYFTNLVLQRLGDGQGDLDEVICDNIREAMLERIRDTKPAVQIQAIEVLQKLQDPFNPDDLVVKAFLSTLCDPSAQVRKAVIRCMGITGCTLPTLLKRCRDIDYTVRQATYDRISQLHLRMVKIEQRQYLLACGLNDVHQKVVNHVKNTLIASWLSNCGDYFEFVKALRLDADEKDWTRTVEIVQQSLNAIFKDAVLKDLMEILPLGPNRVITFVGKNWEQIVYWRCLITYMKSEKALEEYVDQIMPELSIFCVYIRSVHQSRPNCKQPQDILDNQHIMYELLLMLKQFDFSDEFGRKNLLALIRDMLVDTSHLGKNLMVIVEILEQLIPNIDDRFAEINELIYKIRNPFVIRTPPNYLIRQRDVKVAEIRVKINIALYDQEQAIAKADFQTAEKLKHFVNDLYAEMKLIQDAFAEKHAPVQVTRNDVPALCQCLDLLTATLRSAKVKKIPAVVSKLHEEFVEPLMANSDPQICGRMLKFYPLLGIINKAIAMKTLHLFTNRLMQYNAIPSTDVETTLLSLYAITDLLLMYGSTILGKEPQKKRPHKRVLFNESSIVGTGDVTVPSRVTLTEIVDVISSMVDDSNAEVREKACQSLLKLLYRGVINSVSLLSKLVVKWFNPATAKDQRLMQLLGKFFTEFAAIPKSANLMWKLFVPTLSALADAPKNSPLGEVEVLTVIKFLIELSRPSQYTAAIGLQPHTMLSVTLCDEIQQRPNNKVALSYMKVLVLVTPPYEDEVAMKNLRNRVDVLAEMIKDKTVLKYLERYKNKLDGSMSEGVTDPNADLTSRGSNETYLSLTESSGTGHSQNIPINPAEEEEDNDDDDEQYTAVEDGPLEDELPDNAASNSTLGNVPATSADVAKPAVVEFTTKAMKRRKKRGRDKQKATEDPVGDSAKALGNIQLRDDDHDDDAQVMTVQTDSDTEQPHAKAHVPETRAKNPSRKAEGKAKQATKVTARAKSGRKSKTESDVVLPSADSNREEPTTSKQAETRGKKGRKPNTESQIADKKQRTTELTGKRGKKGGRNANEESQQPAAQMDKTDKISKNAEPKSDKESQKVLETAVDSAPEENDPQTWDQPRRRSNRKRTPRKFND